ncbi:hypothetical protein [Streptomyces melanogenes]|uniref:Uncharacterized protein n=1 Tax=Streptomyces melanogenes TaxID=67326 RepID=A0ABZ1XC43_9ACTN|nr:hypothetical protein [Streptomyces melanogenes]
MPTELIVTHANPAVPIWNHFLLTQWEATVEQRSAGSPSGQAQPVRVGPAGFKVVVTEGTAWLRVVIKAGLVLNGASYPLLLIQQEFTVAADGAVAPTRWRKGPPTDRLGLQKGIPALHPLLRLSGNVLALDVSFVDITDLYVALHGGSAWFRAMNFLRGTDRTVRILASLGGHPLVWYVTVPAICMSLPAAKPAIMIMPADYGAIYYENNLKGIQSSLHGTSVVTADNNLQSGLEILARILTEPVSDARFPQLLPDYVALRKSFKGNLSALPGPLHHFRGVLSYDPNGDPVPQYWDVPLGFERAIHDQKYILMVPLMNGGDGGVLRSPGLDRLSSNAIQTIYSHGATLNYDTLDVAKPVVMAYSQAGGNAFTAAANNLDGIRGLILFEVVYTNEYPKDASGHTLALGKDVIPKLLKQGKKVVVIGRWRERPRSFLPDGKRDGITVLPDDANYYLLDYPLPAGKPVSAAHLVIQHRYSRLVDGKHDIALDEILGSTDPRTVDSPTIKSELAVDAVIENYRKAGMSNEAIIRRVFSGKYLPDQPGAFYPHNLILAGGQIFDAKTRTYRGFIHEALTAMG